MPIIQQFHCCCIHHSGTEAKGTPDTLDFAEIQRRIDSPLSKFVQPSHSQTLCLWGEEATYNHVELDYGGPVRLKTKGNTPFIGTYASAFLFRAKSW